MHKITKITLSGVFLINLLSAINIVAAMDSQKQKRLPTKTNKALFDAICRGDRAQLDALLARGDDVNIYDNSNGETPLITAIKHNRIDMVQALLEAGADTEKRDGDGNTALLTIAESNGINIDADSEIVTLLIAAGADLDAQNSFDGRTAIEKVYQKTDTMCYCFDSSIHARNVALYRILGEAAEYAAQEKKRAVKNETIEYLLNGPLSIQPLADLFVDYTATSLVQQGKIRVARGKVMQEKRKVKQTVQQIRSVTN